ncbi:MAG TPA: hypothetical protein VN943_14585 [Candidatus Acidoferrum sp.]|nr:hypothetical protein [Candidatus Acidoferrum sp.]
MNPSSQSRMSFFPAIIALMLSLPFASTAAQQKPAAPPHDMAHKQHNHGGFMQEGMHHAVAKGIKIEQQVDAATHTITVREGPLTLPANTSHMKMPQPPDVFWTIPLDAFLLAYTPRLVDANGNAVPGTVLHHTAFWNTDRSDFLCPNKEEHIFGAGSELTNWIEIPGYGYRVQKGDKIRIETMVHNPTDTAYDKVYLEVKIPYADSTTSTKSVYPTWMDVQSCGNSGYDLKVGKNLNTGTVTVKYNGILLGVGGHMHDYATQIVLEDATRKETVATLDAKLDEKGQLLSMPVVTFYERGGYKFAAGDQLRITATYDNTTGKPLPAGAMGIVVGYFLPADDSAMSALRRKPKPASRQVADATHDM